MKVTLRKRKTKTGTISLYLDIYNDGNRELKYLKMYLVPGKTPTDKKHNKDTQALAEAIRAERQLELQKGLYGFKSKQVNDEKDFLAFVESLMQERKDSKPNHDNWFGAVKHLKAYCNNSLKFKDITPDFLEGFKSYLLSTKMNNRDVKLSQNTCYSYFNKIRAAVNRAFELGMIEDNPVKRVKSIPQGDPHREYLTYEEMQSLVKTDCNNAILKRAFLFSVITGLRWSDVNKITWSQIQQSKKLGLVLTFRQQKTDNQEYLPINEQAMLYMGNREKDEERIFKGLKYSAYMNLELARWVLAAGIRKKITFHCARHTHATMMLSNNVDIYTVSKLLGHRHLKTTEIYTKVIDEKKMEAANSFPNLASI